MITLWQYDKSAGMQTKAGVSLMRPWHTWCQELRQRQDQLGGQKRVAEHIGFFMCHVGLLIYSYDSGRAQVLASAVGRRVRPDIFHLEDMIMQTGLSAERQQQFEALLLDHLLSLGVTVLCVSSYISLGASHQRDGLTIQPTHKLYLAS